MLIVVLRIYDNDDYFIPPWELSSPIIDLTLHSSSKKETTDSVFKQRFLEIKDSYENKDFTPIYTDGSKSDKYVSASVVSSADIYIRLIFRIIQLYLLPKLLHLNLQFSTFSVKSFQISNILRFIIMSSGASR